MLIGLEYDVTLQLIVRDRDKAHDLLAFIDEITIAEGLHLSP